jgi:hypothetical protein
MKNRIEKENMRKINRASFSKKLTAKTFFEGFLFAADSIFFKNPIGPRVHICKEW